MATDDTPPSSDFSDDAAFRAAVGGVLQALLEQLDDLDVDAADDLDVRLTPGNLQTTFEDTGAVFVLSQQTPTHELWLSANLTAWHFRCRGGAWVERDTGEPMLAVLNRLYSEKLGEPVAFAL